jgi:hypothetical protein
MKKHLSLLLILATTSLNAMAQTCPPVIAYRHLSPGATWEIANEYSRQGWTIAETPAAQNYNGHTSLSNALHVVLNNANDTHTFYITCKSELMDDNNGLTVDASNFIAQTNPATNPNFTKIDNNTYICNTTLNHPEACVSYDATPQRAVYDAIGGSIN